MTATLAAQTTGERILAAAAQMTAELGWSEVTMAGIASRVGVSRQTVYNEWRSRGQLAEAMVLRELAAFLDEVDAGFDAHPDDLPAAVEDAIRRVLMLASVNPLLTAIITATHGAGTELVPLLTTRADAVISVAHSRVRSRLATFNDIDASALDMTVDMLVRTVLSHVMQPAAVPASVPGDLSRIVSAVLALKRR